MNNTDQDHQTTTMSTNPAPVTSAVKPMPAFRPWIVYYDQNTKSYVYETIPSGYTRIDYKALEGQHYVKSHRLPVHLGSFDQFVSFIQDRYTVDYAGDLAGYKKGLQTQGSTRILVTSEPTFIDPVEGDWSMLKQVLKNMFGPIQLPYVYGWIKISLMMYAEQEWMAGQVLALCGPPGCGKNLFGEILRWLFGGRKPGRPYAYMTGKTPFNSDFMGCELLTIHDQASLTNMQARRDFGSKLKDFAVNEDQWLHGKHVKAQNITVMQRLLITLNDEPERLLILPVLDNDIKDKLMLMKLESQEMPMPTTTPQERKAFGKALRDQLPAFVAHLKDWEIPKHLTCDRYGIRYYHDPELAASLDELTSESGLLRLIDEVIFPPGTLKGSWKGKASELEAALKGSATSHVRDKADDLLKGPNSCGIFLSRLATKHPHRVVKHPGRARSVVWELLRDTGFSSTSAPEDYEVEENVAPGSPLQPTSGEALREKIRCMVRRG